MQRQSQRLGNSGWYGLFGSSKTQNNQYISIKDVANLDIEASLLLGGVSSIAFFEFIKKTYSAITFAVIKFFEFASGPKDNIKIETKDKSYITDAIQSGALVVRDKIGGIVMNDKGLFYLDSYTMLVYQYSSNTKIGSTSIQYKLAPYVQKLFERFDFDRQSDIGKVTVDKMMNDILLHMILNDMYKILIENEKNSILNAMDKIIIRELLSIVNEKGTSSEKPIESRTMLTKWLNNRPRDIHGLFDKFKPYSKTYRLFLAETEETHSTVKVRETTDLYWDTENMLTNSVLFEIIKLDVNESDSIKHWKELFQIKYQVKYESR